jgi:hypothetical protein
MTAGTFTNAWISQSAKILYRGATPPDSTKFRACLANAALTRTNTLIDFISAELLPINGYTRASLNFAGDGAYDTTDQRHEMPSVSVNFSASGAALQFQTIFILANASSVASKSFTNSGVNPTSNKITINNHAFNNGDKIIISPDDLATLPGGISNSSIYTIANSTANDFEIGVDITNTGSGTFRARTAAEGENWNVIAFLTEDNPITISDGKTYSYVISNLVLMNTGLINGV